MNAQDSNAVVSVATPVDVQTILEDHQLIVQRAMMLTSDDAHVYSRQCRELGASTQIRGLEVKVVYWLAEGCHPRD